MGVSVIVLHERDTVGVATRPIKAGECLGDIGCDSLVVRDDIPQWHKVSLTDIAEGLPVLKYGECIGVASRAILSGQHVHSHNLKAEDA